jgi:hypothetical protein
MPSEDAQLTNTRRDGTAISLRTACTAPGVVIDGDALVTHLRDARNA